MEDYLKSAETAEAVTETAEGFSEDCASETTVDAANAETELTPEEENGRRCEEALKSEHFCLTYKLRFRDLAKFNLRFSLLGIGNILFWLVLVLSSAYLAFFWKKLGAQDRALIIVCVVLLIWLVPVRAVVNAARSAAYLQKSSTPTEYHVCDEGFVIFQDEVRGLLTYDKIRRITETKSTLYAYVLKNSGFIFPRDLVGERYDELKAILKAHISGKE